MPFNPFNAPPRPLIGHGCLQVKLSAAETEARAREGEAARLARQVQLHSVAWLLRLLRQFHPGLVAWHWL